MDHTATGRLIDQWVDDRSPFLFMSLNEKADFLFAKGNSANGDMTLLQQQTTWCMTFIIRIAHVRHKAEIFRSS